MVLDAMIDGDSLTIDIADPFHPDLVALVSRIGQFFHSKGADISGLDVSELILGMIKGIAGCEKGCPADANGIASRAFKGFELQYREGGFLSAHALLRNDRHFYLKMFPDS